MNELEIFRNEEFGEIRTLLIDGECWFVGKDVARILGYQNGSRDVKRHVDEEDKITQMIPQYQNGTLESKTILINESGLYSLIMSSKLPKAKKFKKWVTSEVLPSIRKIGSYKIENTNPIDTPDMEEMTKYLTEIIVNIAPKLVYETIKLVKVPEKENKGNIKKLTNNHYKVNLYQDKYPLKMTTFPSDIIEEVDLMLVNMAREKKLNFSEVVRFCKVKGFEISVPSVKNYFNKVIVDLYGQLF